MDARCLIGLKWGHDEDNLHTRTAWESPLLFLQAFRCKFLAVFDDGLHVRLRPFGQLGNERHERAAYFRQAYSTFGGTVGYTSLRHLPVL